MEPVSLLIGGGLVVVGWMAGRWGRRRPAGPPPPPVATCGCGHPLSQHDPAASTCHAEIPRDAYKFGRWAGHTWVRCPCRQYVGPRPIDEVFAPRLLLPPVD